MSLIKTAKKYFKTFSNKDLSGLEKMFSRYVSLKDWEIEAIGIEEVLKANKKIFESVDSINVNPLKIYNDGNTIIAEINISINNRETILSIVDIIQFNDEGMITEIRAFKR